MPELNSSTNDDDLQRRTVLALYARGACGADQIVVRATGGTIVLCGELPSRAEQSRCVECCKHVAGVMRVVDLLRVRAANPGSSPELPSTDSRQCSESG